MAVVRTQWSTVRMYVTMVRFVVRCRSIDATDARSTARIPPRARASFVTDRDSSSVPLSIHARHSSALPRDGEPRRRARAAGVAPARAASWVRLVRVDAMDARERGKGSGVGVCSRARRVRSSSSSRARRRRWMITRARARGDDPAG